MFCRVGYHGTTEVIKQQILNNPKSLVVSENPYDWLGSGFYLWEGDAQRALEFAETRIKRAINDNTSSFHGGTPAVVGIAYHEGRCLNLATSHHTAYILRAFERLKKIYQPLEVTNNPEKYWDKKLNNLVFNFIDQITKLDNQPPFQTIKGYFKEGKEIIPHSGIYHQDHVQVCIRPPFINDLIIGVFDPLKLVQTDPVD